MKALILSGGKGTRLKPHTFTKAKQLVPLMNKPVLGHVLDHVSGITKDIGIVVSPERKNDIINYVRDGRDWDAKITYIVQNEPLGLAHAIKVSRDFLKNDKFIMYLGDNIVEDNIINEIKEFKKSNIDALIFLKEVEDPRQFGVAKIDDEGNLIELIEKPENPPSNLAVTGIYLFSNKIFEAVENIEPSKRGELEITDAITYLIKQGYDVRAKLLKGVWIDTGKKDDVIIANSFILDKKGKRKIEGKVKNSNIEGRVIVEKNAIVENSIIKGPSIIGKGTIISNSYIGPYTSIGENCKIYNSRINHSIIMNNSNIENVEILEESLIGENSSIKKGKFNRISLSVGDYSKIEI